MFKREALDQLIDYILETWNLDSSQSAEIAEGLSDIFLKCFDEYMYSPDRITKATYKNLEKALEHLVEADNLLSKSFTVSFDKAPFNELLTAEYAQLKDIGTLSKDDSLKKLQGSAFMLRLALDAWLKKYQPVPPTRAHHRRKIIIERLHTLYQELTGEQHIDRNHPEEIGDRVHTPFSKVAILLDRLVGNPHRGIAAIDVWKGSKLNISEIVNSTPTTISSFCKDIKRHID